MTAYDLGDVAVLTVSFSVAGVLTDPTAVTATVRKPDGTATPYTTPTIVHASTGVYKLNVPVDQVGIWEYQFTGTGAAADVETGSFYGLPDPTLQNARDLCRLADIAARVPGYVIGADNAIDSTLAELIDQESRDFQDTTHREIVRKNTQLTRVFDIDWFVAEERELAIGDAASVTAVVFKQQDGTVLQTLSSDAWIELPRVGERQDWQPITALRFPPLVLDPARLSACTTCEVTGTWGFPVIPTTVRRAVATLVVSRYLNDVAAAGTLFADLANQADLNMAGTLRAALDIRDRLRIRQIG